MSNHRLRMGASQKDETQGPRGCFVEEVGLLRMIRAPQATRQGGRSGRGSSLNKA